MSRFEEGDKKVGWRDSEVASLAHISVKERLYGRLTIETYLCRENGEIHGDYEE